MAASQEYNFHDDLNNYDLREASNNEGAMACLNEAATPRIYALPIDRNVDGSVPDFFKEFHDLGTAECAKLRKVRLTYTADFIPSACMSGPFVGFREAGRELGKTMMQLLKKHGLRPGTVECIIGGPFKEPAAQEIAEGWRKGMEAEAREAVFRFH